MEKKVYDLVVDEELEHVAPPLDDTELEILRDDILEHGCKFPLIVWGDIIVDGHNRYRICREEDIPFGIEEMDFSDKTEAKLWIIKNQLGRRNLKPFQRCEMILPMEEEIKADAEKRRRTRISATKRGEDMVPPVAPSPKSRDIMAMMAGVSHTTLGRVKYILANADEETIGKLRQEELKIGPVFNALTRPKPSEAPKEEPREEQAETETDIEEEPSDFESIEEQLNYAFDTFMGDLQYALDWLSGETATEENEARIMGMIDELMKKAKNAVTKKMEEEKNEQKK